MTHGEYHHHIGVNYNVGRYAPKQNLGKIIVNIDNSEKVRNSLIIFILLLYLNKR